MTPAQTTSYAVNLMTTDDGGAQHLVQTSQQPTLDAAHRWVQEASSTDPAVPMWATATVTRLLPTGESAPPDSGTTAWLCALTPTGTVTAWIPTILAAADTPEDAHR